MVLRRRISKRSTTPAVAGLLHVGIVACMLALALLPLIGTGSVAAEEDDKPIALVEAVDPNLAAAS